MLRFNLAVAITMAIDGGHHMLLEKRAIHTHNCSPITACKLPIMNYQDIFFPFYFFRTQEAVHMYAYTETKQCLENSTEKQ